ncbi:protein lifeguard 1 [Genypterus blacodes]|uniref:protein lifeguard 1 n=1 Tax=Genypterus blacodes TaxID=154954 RepID=UPI003F768CA3
MDRSHSRGNGSHEPCPPPYNAQDPHSPYSGVTYEVGKGDIVVISPAGPYPPVRPGDQAAGGDDRYAESLPDHFGSDPVDTNVFNDVTIRRGFIRKVYLTLMLQLLVTVGIICAFLYWDTLREFTWSNPWFSYSMMPVVMVLIVALSCCDNLRRQVPLNFIALGLFTIVEGMMLGSVAVFFEAEAVLWAAGATAVVSFSLSLFAMQTKWDFTTANGFLWVFTWTLISFALFCAILRSQYLYIVYACLGTLLFSMYLVFDTQLILGGQHRKYEISPEEYIFAALSLYLDIVNLFLFLLRLFGLCR